MHTCRFYDTTCEEHHMCCCLTAAACAGMVRETGEATERFLRSMAAGDASVKRELEEAVAAALVNVSLPCNTADPGSMTALAGNLVQGAHTLNRQLQGLLTALRSATGMPRQGCVGCGWVGGCLGGQRLSMWNLSCVRVHTHRHVRTSEMSVPLIK
jgi:hypothetical protein